MLEGEVGRRADDPADGPQLDQVLLPELECAVCQLNSTVRFAPFRAGLVESTTYE